jgi:hypothetical protein
LAQKLIFYGISVFRKTIGNDFKYRIHVTNLKVERQNPAYRRKFCVSSNVYIASLIYEKN